MTLADPRIVSLLRVALAGVLACAVGVRLAHADVYTWTDASGRLNVSNIAPPEGARVTRVVHEDPPSPNIAAARAAEVRALNERVAQLEDEVERAQRQSAPPVPYRVVAAPVAPAAQVHVAVTVMPPPVQEPMPQTPYGLDCDPLVFGCPAFGYPANVVVLREPRFHRFRHFDRFHAAHGIPGARMPRRSAGFRHR